MSQENLEIVRHAIEANNSSDHGARTEAFLALWDPSCEYTSVIAVLEPSTYRGHDGIRRYVSDLAERWAEWRSDVEDVSEVRPDTVVVSIRFSAVGKDSGVPIEARLGAVCVLSDGKLLRGQTYPSRAEALEAAGLSE